jgi:RNA polymerase sigma-70 factor (ECF subfamily)
LYLVPAALTTTMTLFSIPLSPLASLDATAWSGATHCRNQGQPRSANVAAVSEEDDDQLITRVQSGDPRAYRELVERHVRGVHAFVYRMLGSRAEAEEVCQESFLRLWKHADTFVARAKPSTWLYRVAHNLAIDRLRRRREAAHPLGIEEVPGSDRPSLHLYDKQVAEAVERALGELPERQRAAISLVHYQGMSNAEAAEVLGVKVRALESLLARGRLQLRERLADFKSREGSDV